jgi:transcriptional regulator NrdR family protein
VINLKVQKKDGRIEDFDRAKVKNGILRSGATEEQAESVTQEVESWAVATSTNNIVRALDIKVKLLEVLGGVNPNAKASFENFKKA